MNRIDRKFHDLRKKGQKAFIAFITAGDPDVATTQSIVLEIEKKGADIVELGVPFSDPMADGPTIQKASLRALKNNTSLRDVLQLVRNIRKISEIPLVIMSSYNPIFKYGEERFVQDSVASGLDGVIIPDLPPEEGENLIRLSESAGLNLIMLIAPTTPRERAAMLAEKSRGFIYYVSVMGITGERESLPDEIREGIEQVKGLTDKPIAVGFGISRPEHVQALSPIADGIIVGSAIIRIIENNLTSPQLVSRVGEFVSLLKKNI
jgi:tryptophan synthase alpha chain